MKRLTFDELTAQLLPLVIANIPNDCSVGKAKEIAEDCTFLIHRGKSVNMLSESDARKEQP